MGVYALYESLIRAPSDQLIIIFTGFQSEELCSTKCVVIFNEFRKNIPNTPRF